MTTRRRRILKPCRACLTRLATRARGLCPRCYYDPATRYRHEVKEVHAQDHFGGHALPARPTDALPGTEAKVLVLAARAAANVQLFHPADARRPRGDNPAAEALFRLIVSDSVEPREDVES